MHIEKIICCNCYINEKNFLEIDKILPKFIGIRELNLSDNKHLRGGCLILLNGLINCRGILEKINFSNCSMNDRNIFRIDESLSQFTNLSDVNFSGNTELGLVCFKIQKGLLNSRSTLKTVNFSNCSLKDNEVSELAGFLQNFSNLIEFNIAKNFSLKKVAKDSSKTYITLGLR